jgi:hypothetical protein
MYPAGDLSELAGRKRRIQERIRRRRGELALEARRLAQPIALVDRGVALWRRTSPWIRYVVLPAGFLARRGVIGPRVRVPRWLRWAPVVLRTARLLREMAAARRAQ